MSQCRIFTFGYDSGEGKNAVKNIEKIPDIARDLLHDLKFAQDRRSEIQGIGQVPIVFVSHSLGGLIAKAAYLLGRNDDGYAAIVQLIKGMVFLGTPHRGSDQASALNNLLKAKFKSSADFFVELRKGSPVVQDINDRFRHIAPKLAIASFYGNRYASSKSTKGKYTGVVGDATTPGYHQEVSLELNADHSDMSKYYSRRDQNYIIVRDTLVSLVVELLPKGIDTVSSLVATELESIEKLLDVSSTHLDGALSYLRSVRFRETCTWIFETEAMKDWHDGRNNELSSVHLASPPASGKSIVCSYVVDYLRTTGRSVQLFLFRSGDQNRQAVSFFLRSMAAQLASDNSVFRQCLLSLVDGGFQLTTSNSEEIFRTLFASFSAAVNAKIKYPIYWVVDGVDEAESPITVLDYISRLQDVFPFIHVFITSRSAVDTPYDRGNSALLLGSSDSGTNPPANFADMRLLVKIRLRELRGSNDVKAKVGNTILFGAEGNFLWAGLVLDGILSCQGEEAVNAALDSLPRSLDDLYRRMELSTLSLPSAEHKQLAQRLFQWIVCARYCLSIKEITQAVGIVSAEPQKSIAQLCGRFVVVDSSDRVRLIHRSAREYMMTTAKGTAAVKLTSGHSFLFSDTLSTLCSLEQLPTGDLEKEGLQDREPYLVYAATSWMYHLYHAGDVSDEAIGLICRFFENSSVLVWINILALVERLDVLTETADVLLTICTSINGADLSKMPESNRQERLSAIGFISKWYEDLVRLKSKFSIQLLQCPSAILGTIPPLCPENSAIHQQFSRNESTDIMVWGVSHADWDDRLARLSIPRGEEGVKICCSAHCVAVLCSSGKVIVWDSTHFQQICVLDHREPVTALAFSRTGDKMLTFGLSTSKLWSIPTGKRLSTIQNPANSRAITVAFRDDKVLAGCTNRHVYYLRLTALTTGWTLVNENLLREETESTLDAAATATPKCMEFNRGITHVAASYRDIPLSVWDMRKGECIGKCFRPLPDEDLGSRSTAGRFAVDKFTWNPVTGHILGLYKDGVVFKWDPVADSYEELHGMASDIAVSPNGRLFITRNSIETVKVWDFETLTFVEQLSSGDQVSELAFAPDSRRFYDIRGSSLNVWQSNTMLRFVENGYLSSSSSKEEEDGDEDEEEDDDEPETIEEATEYSDPGAAVTVISTSASQGSTLHCAGNGAGSVSILEAGIGSIGDIVRFPNFMAVSCLTWSEDANFVACADEAGDVEVRHVTIKPLVEHYEKPKPSTAKEGRNIYGLLFNRDSTLLLIATRREGHICSVNEGTMQGRRPLVAANRGFWFNHPTRSDVVLNFGAERIAAYRWSDFSEVMSWPYTDGTIRNNPDRQADPNVESDDLPIVQNARVTANGALIIIQRSNVNIDESVLIIDPSSLELPTRRIRNIPVSAYSVPRTISAEVNIPLGLLSGSRFAFLDKDLCVCTYAMRGDNEHDIRRHYFIPRDWASTESFKQCRVLEDSTLLCPRGNEVAVIMSVL